QNPPHFPVGARMSRPTSKALAELIQSQALDDGAESVTPEDHRVRNETDTGLTLDYLADKRPGAKLASRLVAAEPCAPALLGVAAVGIPLGPVALVDQVLDRHPLALPPGERPPGLPRIMGQARGPIVTYGVLSAGVDGLGS